MSLSNDSRSSQRLMHCRPDFKEDAAFPESAHAPVVALSHQGVQAESWQGRYAWVRLSAAGSIPTRCQAQSLRQALVGESLQEPVHRVESECHDATQRLTPSAAWPADVTRIEHKHHGDSTEISHNRCALHQLLQPDRAILERKPKRSLRLDAPGHGSRRRSPGTGQMVYTEVSLSVTFTEVKGLRGGSSTVDHRLGACDATTVDVGSSN